MHVYENQIEVSEMSRDGWRGSDPTTILESSITSVHTLVNSQKDALVSLVQTSLLQIAEHKAEILVLKEQMLTLQEHLKQMALKANFPT